MKFFEEIILQFYFEDNEKYARFKTKNGDDITDEYLQNHYFEETGFIENTEQLKYTWQRLIQTRYEQNTIGYREIYRGDYFFLTKYFPTNKYSKLNQDFIFDFKKGKNTEYYAKIFSESILNLLNQDKELAKTITILPIPASTKLGTEKRYKKLFELISENTGVINGYDIIKVTKDREASHLIGKYYNVENNYEIDFDKISYPYRIIIIDDIITKGGTFINIVNKIKESSIIKNKLKMNSSLDEYKNFIIGLFLGETYSSYRDYDYYKKCRLEKAEFKLPINDLISKGKDFLKIKNFDIKNNINWFNYCNDNYQYKFDKEERQIRNLSKFSSSGNELIKYYIDEYYVKLAEQGNLYIQIELAKIYEQIQEYTQAFY
ncbi:hypothetical protein, partial [uncultured Fusobacterium sp.]